MAPSTVKLRLRELRDVLVLLARENLPSVASITKANIQEHLPALLEAGQQRPLRSSRGTAALALIVAAPATNLPASGTTSSQTASPRAPALVAPPSAPGPLPPVLPAAAAEAMVPPSFRKQAALRERRALKLLRARMRLKALFVSSPGLASLFPALAKHDGAEQSQATLKESESTAANLDEEDLLIERLLLQGVGEQAILSGYYDATPSSSCAFKPAPDLKLLAPQFSREELDDDEVRRHIRTNQEVMCSLVSRG